MPTGVIAPLPKWTGFDNDGNVLAGGKLYTYAAGTSTLQNTFSESTLTTPNTNPVVLDAAGRATIYLTPAIGYKFVLKTSADVTLWTQDNITATSATTGVTSIVAGANVTITETGAVVGTGDVTVNVTVPAMVALDFVFAFSATILGRLAKGTALQIPRMNATATAWEFAAPADVTARAGGIAIASQAAEDAIYAASETQLGRMALTALQSVRKNAANTALEAYMASVAVYVATLADVSNTASETTILSFTIPANAMADGDTIEIQQVNLEKNNKGTAGTAAVKINAGAGGQVTLAAATTYSDSATEYRTSRRIWLQRVGTSIEVLSQNAPTAQAGAAEKAPEWWAAPEKTVNLGVSTPTNFTSVFVVSLKVTLSAAHASFYVKPQAAKVVHVKT